MPMAEVFKRGAQVCDVVVEDGGVADGEARHIRVAQELGLQHTGRAVVEGDEGGQVAEVVVVDAQHVEQKPAAAPPVLRRTRIAAISKGLRGERGALGLSSPKVLYKSFFCK